VAQVRAWYLAEGRPAPRFSETLLSAYESGQKRPGPEYLHYVCAAYRADPADLGYEGPCLCGHSHRRVAAPPPAVVSPPAIAPPAARGAGAGAAGADAEADDLRRMLIRLMADADTPVDCRFLGAVDRMRRRMDDALLGGTVSAAMIDQWEETTAGYGRRMCAERQPLEFAERLCRVAGQLAGAAGIILLDLGDQRLARSFFRTARTATDETGDRRLRAWVAVREALVPLYYGEAGVMGPVIEARAQARLARLARRSERGLRDCLDQVRAALERSREALSDLSAQETSDTAFGYTERQFYFHAGDALGMLGDHQEAQRAFSRALLLYPAA
jgi:tetratricopeptide (TPR) repeat protein